MRRVALVIGLFAALAVGSAPAHAASITVNYTPGTLYTTAGITDYSTHSSDMNGMSVTATWLTGTTSHTQTDIWDSGVWFTGSDFDLMVSGDTYDNDAWQLDFSLAGSNNKLQSLIFDGSTDRTVFDLTWGGAVGTAGSSNGKTFQDFEKKTSNFGCGLFSLQACWSDTADIDATYSNRLMLQGSAGPVGDLYTRVALSFTGGLGEGEYRFTMDTDNATTSIVQQTTVPEPASMLLLGTGLFGLAGAARRRLRR